jgi:hypothetical protein
LPLERGRKLPERSIPRRDQDLVLQSFTKNLAILARQKSATPNRRLQFHKRRQPFIRTHNEVFSIAAVRAVYLAEKTMTSFERLLF